MNIDSNNIAMASAVSIDIATSVLTWQHFHDTNRKSYLLDYLESGPAPP